MATFKYFSGTTELSGFPMPVRNAEFAARFPGVKGRRYDGFSMLVARDSFGVEQPVTRVIKYKSRPSLHKCGDKCRSAKGPNCECECGGQFHGCGN